MYKSIIDVTARKIHSQWESSVEGLILKQVGEIGVTVDKDELVKALQYDRDQYDAGFADGRRAAAPKWIPVTERLPEQGQEVIVCVLHRFGDKTVCWKRFWGETHFSWQDVTHWMPLPEPPKEGE